LTLAQVVAAAVLVAVTAMLLREGGSRFAPAAIALGGVLLLAVAVGRLSESVRWLRALTEATPLTPYVGVMLKALGVGYVVEVGADVCRDLGAEGTAAKLELCGKAEILLLCLPYLGELLELALSLVV